MPYLAATQDEKMYRVLRDRERWFQIIMSAPAPLEALRTSGPFGSRTAQTAGRPTARTIRREGSTPGFGLTNQSVRDPNERLSVSRVLEPISFTIWFLRFNH